jgi:hypothetical protein
MLKRTLLGLLLISLSALACTGVNVHAMVAFLRIRQKSRIMVKEDTSSLEDTIDSIFSDVTGAPSSTISGTHPEPALENEDLNENDLDWF